MSKKTDKIREKIATLNEELKAAEAAESQRQQATLVRVAKRSGLLEVALSERKMEAEFRAIVIRCNGHISVGSQSSGVGHGE